MQTWRQRIGAERGPLLATRGGGSPAMETSLLRPLPRAGRHTGDSQEHLGGTLSTHSRQPGVRDPDRWEVECLHGVRQRRPVHALTVGLYALGVALAPCDWSRDDANGDSHLD